VRNRVAVLPFDENIADTRRVHASWAVSDYLTRTLARTTGARVPSSGTVARAWMESDGRIERLASLLGVDFVVAGQTSTRGGFAEISVSIWDAASGEVRWSKEYEYPSLSLRQIQDSLAAKIGMLVETPVRSLASANAYASPAYDDLTRGDFFLRRPTPEGTDSARVAYARAIKTDPVLAVAKVRLARAIAFQVARSGRAGSLTSEPAVAHGLALVDSALGLDARLAEAWTVRAMLLRSRDPERFAGALAAHERAISLDPTDADAYEQLGETHLLLGNDGAAAERFRRALELDPNRAATLRALAELEILARRFDASCAFANASIAADPFDPLAYAVRAQVRLQLGEFRDAYADAEIAARLSGERWGDALRALVIAGARDDRAKRQTRQLAQSRLKPSAVFSVREARYLAAALAMIGDGKSAVDALSRARPKGAEFRTALRDPSLDTVRREARFQQMMRAASTADSSRARTSS
jgi:tetratricopeptide (TPR) repeat protein